MLVPFCAKWYTVQCPQGGWKIRLELFLECKAKPSCFASKMFSLGLSSPQPLLKPYSYALLPVSSTADKRVSVSKGINNNYGSTLIPIRLFIRNINDFFSGLVPVLKGFCGILARGKKMLQSSGKSLSRTGWKKPLSQSGMHRRSFLSAEKLN